MPSLLADRASHSATEAGEGMKNALTLYEIADRYLNALDVLTDSDMDPQIVADTMESIEGELVVKGQAVTAYILNMEAEVEAIEEAAKKLAHRAKVLRNHRDSLKGYLHEQMIRTGITEIKALDGTFRARIRNNPRSVEVIDEAFIPEQYTRLIPERREPDKTAIKEAIEAGETVPGVMVRQTTRLEIKT